MKRRLYLFVGDLFCNPLSLKVKKASQQLLLPLVASALVHFGSAVSLDYFMSPAHLSSRAPVTIQRLDVSLAKPVGSTSLEPVVPDRSAPDDGALGVAEATSLFDRSNLASPSSKAALIYPDVFTFDLKRLYLPARELDSRPRADVDVAVPFPDDSMAGTSGSVILELYLSATGHVDFVDVASSDLPESFQFAAANAFRGQILQPGMKNGQTVPSRMKILVEFEDVLLTQRRVLSGGGGAEPSK